MATRVVIYTENDYLFRKIYLELKGKAVTVRTADTQRAPGEILIIDRDGTLEVSDDRGTVTLTVPFPLGAVSDTLFRDTGRQRLTLADKGAVLDGEWVALTDLEHRLLSHLVSAGGYVSRKELISALWGEGATESALNVYIHYLRQKLERGGERLILSCRRLGYSLNPIFTGKGAIDADSD